jgi:hypothetical protein
MYVANCGKMLAVQQTTIMHVHQFPMAYHKIITTRLWLAISMMGFPKYIRKTGQISNRTGNFIFSNIQSNINFILLKQWSETKKCPSNTVIQQSI